MAIMEGVGEGRNYEYFYQKKSLKFLNGEWEKSPGRGENSAHSRKATDEKQSTEGLQCNQGRASINRLEISNIS